MPCLPRCSIYTAPHKLFSRCDTQNWSRPSADIIRTLTVKMQGLRGDCRCPCSCCQVSELPIPVHLVMTSDTLCRERALLGCKSFRGADKNPPAPPPPPPNTPKTPLPLGTPFPRWLVPSNLGWLVRLGNQSFLFQYRYTILVPW